MPLNAPGLLQEFENKEGSITTNAPIDKLSENVRFSLKHCEQFLGKKDFCLLEISKVEAEKLYKTLGRLESIAWKDAVQIPHDRGGMSSEKKKSETYKKLKRYFPDFTNFFHFRVNGVGTGIFRVFGSREKDICYLLLFDRKGKIHIAAHK